MISKNRVIYIDAELPPGRDRPESVELVCYAGLFLAAEGDGRGSFISKDQSITTQASSF
jgi:hypothetical protein